MIALELDVADPHVRARLGAHVEAVFRLKRALQRDARARVDAYWAAFHERKATSPKAVRERLGLTRVGLEAAAKRHVEDSKWMRDHLTKAQALHVADEVWAGVDRHLFPDRSGQRHGRPRVGKWWDFRRCVGRAKSHTKDTPTWETYRLVGSLDGHLATYAAPGWDGDLTPGARVLAQPQRLPVPAKPAGSWWDHDGALAVVYTGLSGGDLVLPVRLPSGAGRHDRLRHFLEDPGKWHKIDLVRQRDRRALGGWRYYAHLMILGPGHTSDSTKQRRAATPDGRVFCVDGNVSNLSVVSRLDQPDIADVRAGQVTVTPDQRQAAQLAAAKQRHRAKALDRSRRASNADQYHPSPRQAKREQRRAERGQAPKQETLPKGARKGNAAGVPTRAYHKDTLSGSYRRGRADHAADARSMTQAKQARADHVAQWIVAVHGPTGVTEHVNMRGWAALWGKGINLFSPGMLMAALARECAAVGGSIRRAATTHTALSQTCFCGNREKKPLSQRDHDCRTCGVRGDRDLVSAAMGTCVAFADPDDPRSARVDPNLAAAFGRWLQDPAQQEALVRSTSTAAPASAGTGKAGSHLRVAAAGHAEPWPPHPVHRHPCGDVAGPGEPAAAMNRKQLRFIS